MSKWVLVTGASRGIGLGFTRRLLEKGYSVFGVSRQNQSESLSALSRDFPQTFFPIQAEITQAQGREKIRVAIQEKTSALDWLINNAGMYPEGDDDVKTLTNEGLLEAFEVNAIAPVFLTRELMPLLKKSNQAKTFYVTSLMGSISDNTSGGSYGYRMSKVALNMAVKSLAIDFPDIAAILFHPGWVQTDMGGSQAPTTIDESVQGMLAVADRVGLRQTGQFFDFEGHAIKW